MKRIIFLILITFIFCKTKEEKMADYIKCANQQVGKKFTDNPKARGPDEFNGSSLIWYCRMMAGFDIGSTIYVNWKDVKYPKAGSNVFGITKDNGKSVSTEKLGIVVSENPTMVVVGDEEQGIIVKKELVIKKKYIRVEYQYVDF